MVFNWCRKLFEPVFHGEPLSEKNYEYLPLGGYFFKNITIYTI